MDNDDKIKLTDDQLKEVSGCGTIADAPYCPMCKSPKRAVENFCEKMRLGISLPRVRSRTANWQTMQRVRLVYPYLERLIPSLWR